MSTPKTEREKIRNFLTENLSIMIPDVIVKGSYTPNFNNPLPRLVANGDTLRNISRIINMTPSELANAIGYSISETIPEYCHSSEELVKKEVDSIMDNMIDDQSYAEAVAKAALERLESFAVIYKNSLYDLMSAIRNVRVLDEAIGSISNIIEQRRIARLKRQKLKEYIDMVRANTKELEISESFSKNDPDPRTVVLAYITAEDFYKGYVRYYKGFRILTEVYKSEQISRKTSGRNNFTVVAFLKFNNDFFTGLNTSSVDSEALTNILNSDSPSRTCVLTPHFCDYKITKLCPEADDNVLEATDKGINKMINAIRDASENIEFRVSAQDNQGE